MVDKISVAIAGHTPRLQQAADELRTFLRGNLAVVSRHASTYQHNLDKLSRSE